MSTTAKNPSTASKKQAEVAESLNLVLADSYALMALTHLAHWNVEGEDFFPLHKAFQEQYENLFEAFETENRKNPNASADRLFKDVMNRLASNAGADYEIILPIGEVQSVNVFHVDSYLEYFTSKAYQMPRSP